MDMVGEMWTWGSNAWPPTILGAENNSGARILSIKAGGVDIEKFRNVDFGLVGFPVFIETEASQFLSFACESRCV